MASNPLRKFIDHVLAIAQENGTDLDAATEVTIRRDLVGVASWTTPNPAGAGRSRHSHDAHAGEVVTMPNRAALRLAVLGCIDGINPGDLVDEVKAAGKAVDPAILRDIARPRSTMALANRAVDPVAEVRDADTAATPAPAPTAVETVPEVAPPAPGPVDGAAPVDEVAAPVGASLADFVEPAGDGTGDEPASELDDTELGDMPAEALVAHLTQFPGDAQRVRALELTRTASRQRSTVLKATGLTDDEVAELTGADH